MNVFPVHGEHTLLVFVVPGVVMMVPASHDVQGVHAVASLPVEYAFEQVMQPRSVDVVPTGMIKGEEGYKGVWMTGDKEVCVCVCEPARGEAEVASL